MRIDVALNERVLVHLNSKPVKYLGPGRHHVWTGLAKTQLVRLNTDQLVASLYPDQLALIPAEDIWTIVVGPYERALVSVRGRAQKWLGAGEHNVWTVDRILRREAKAQSAVAVETYDVAGVETLPLRDDIRALVPAADYEETTAPEGTVALRYVDGVLDAALGAGRHAAWTVRRKVTFAVIDLREKLVHVNAQEVMTKDRVTLRLNVAGAYRVADPKRLASVARDPEQVLYLAMQLAAREAVATHLLDELLEGRDALSEAILPTVARQATALGLELLTLGVKDIVLPGEMKTLLNRVIEAQKQAEANVITRREETAATRSMAQTAKVLAENPILVRLKELEAYGELAGKVGQVSVVIGGDGILPQLQLKA